MNDLDPIKPLTAFGPPLTNVPSDGVVGKMNAAYRNALPSPTAGPALTNVPTDATGAKMRSAYRDAVMPAEGQVPPVVAAPTVPNVRMPGDVRAGAPAMPPRVVRNVPIVPDNNIDPASGMAINPQAAGVSAPGSNLVRGIGRVYDEAGGGARGAGAVTRDVGGQLFTGGVILPVKAAAGALGAVGSTVADFAAGMAGDAVAQPKVLSQPVGKGVPAAQPGPGEAPLAPLPPAVVRKAGPTTGAEAAPGGNLSVIPTVPGGGYTGTPGFTASGGPVVSGLSAARAAAAARGDFDSVAASYQTNGGTFNGETATDTRARELSKAASYATGKKRAQLIAEATALQAGQVAKNKAATDATAAAATTDKVKADTAATNLANQTRQKSQDMLAQLAQLDNTNDPDGSQRRAIQENLLVVMHGKDPAQDKFVQYEEGTGNIDPLTNKEQVIKKLFNTRTGKPVETPKAPPESNPKALEIKRKVQAGEISRADGIKQLNALGMK